MRIALASVVAAVALFFFGFVWWGLLMPIVRPADVITDASLVENMASSLDGSGPYFFPDYAGSDDATSGPAAILYFNRQAPAMSTVMGLGFGHMLISTLIASVFASLVSARTFATRFGVVFFLGLFVAVWADVGNMIWWRHPLPWTGFHFGYDVLSWVIGGLIIASIVKS